VTGNTASPISPLRPNDPSQLGPYRLAGRIGRGGMGTVFLAVTESGERAAVKVINPDLADDDSFRDRFRREVESARRVRRFCTAPVLDAQLEGDPLYIVTEYVDGPNLEEIVDAQGPLRGANLEGLAVGVATALTAIHGAGVVHRDLKPANVLLSSVGPRVIDFGIARALDTMAQATKTGLFIGTPSYMAPELVSGEKATPASDIFAWGCVMAFAASGRPLYEATTAPAILYQIVHAEPSLDDVDPAMRGIVERSLAKDPRDRPTAQQLLDRLVGQQHADTSLGADTAEDRWPAEAVSGRDMTMVTPASAAPTEAQHTRYAPQPGGPPPTRVGGPAPDPHQPPTQVGPPPGTYDPTRVAPPGMPGAPGQPPPPGPPGHGGPGGPGGAPYPTAGAASGPAAGPRKRLLLMGGAALVALALVGAVTAYALSGSDAPPTATTEVYGDDFSDTGTGWSGGTFTTGYGYSGGAYRVDATDNPYAIQVHEAPLKSAIPERSLISATVRVTSGPAYGQAGLYCRGNTDPTGYQFLVRADGKEAMIRKVVKDAGSRELAKRPVSADYNAKGVNTLQAGCEKEAGSVRLRLWINGELVVENADASKPLATAGAGVLATREAGGSGGNLTAYFDNFKIDEITGE
jgi:hypothetical protein